MGTKANSKWAPHQKLLQKFSQKQLLDRVVQMDFMEVVAESDSRNSSQRTGESSIESLSGMTKAELINECVKKLKRSGTPEYTLNHLRLLHMQLSSRPWSMYQFGRRGVSDDEVILDELHEIEDAIVRQLELRFLVEVAAQLQSGYYYIIIALTVRSKAIARAGTAAIKNPRPSCSVIVHRANSNFIAVTGLRKNFADSVFEALKNVFQFTDYSLIDLADKNLKGMFLLAADKDKPEILMHDADDAEVSSEEEFTTEFGSIVDLQSAKRKARKQYSRDKFGRDLPPPLTSYTFKLSGIFNVAKKIPELAEYRKEALNVGLVFGGSDVISGIRDMVRLGVIGSNLPEEMANIRTNGENISKVVEETRQRRKK